MKDIIKTQIDIDAECSWQFGLALMPSKEALSDRYISQIMRITKPSNAQNHGEKAWLYQ